MPVKCLRIGTFRLIAPEKTLAHVLGQNSPPIEVYLRVCRLGSPVEGLDKTSAS